MVFHQNVNASRGPHELNWNQSRYLSQFLGANTPPIDPRNKYSLSYGYTWKDIKMNLGSELKMNGAQVPVANGAQVPAVNDSAPRTNWAMTNQIGLHYSWGKFVKMAF